MKRHTVLYVVILHVVFFLPFSEYANKIIGYDGKLIEIELIHSAFQKFFSLENIGSDFFKFRFFCTKKQSVELKRFLTKKKDKTLDFNFKFKFLTWQPFGC